MRPKLSTLQAGRALAACAVLLFHTEITLALPKYFGRDIFPVLRQANSGVDYFFVLSGFVIYLAHRQDIGRSAQLLPFFWKRLRRIYPPLWAVLLVLLPVFLTHSSFGRGGETSPQVVISAFLLSPYDKNLLLAPEWTLRREALFYLIFAVSIWKPRIGAIAAASWLIASICVSLLPVTHLWHLLFSSYDVLFAFGVLAGALFVRGFEGPPRLLLLVGSTVFIATWWVLGLSRTLTEDPVWANWTYGVGATLLMLGGVLWEKRAIVSVPPLLMFLGEASYSIYLVHYPIVSLMSKVVMLMHPQRYVSQCICFLVCVTVALLCGIVFHVIVEKRLLRLIPTVITPVRSGTAAWSSVSAGAK